MNKKMTSIDKAFLIIDCFTEENFQLTLDELVKLTDIPKTTLYRLISILEKKGYVMKQTLSNKTWYSLGYLFIEKGFMVNRNLDIRDFARESMMKLRNELNLNVQLAIQDGVEAIYIEQFQSWRPVRIYPSIGKTVPLYIAACPRVLLAYMEKEDQKYVLKHLEDETGNIQKSKEDFYAILSEIKQKGFSTSHGEIIEGTTAFAVPIFMPHKTTPIASLSIVGMEQDFYKEQDFYIEKLISTSNEITEKISEK